MTDNIKRLSKDALNGVDKFLYGKAALKNEEDELSEFYYYKEDGCWKHRLL
mgnify:CR=1 FL=1